MDKMTDAPRYTLVYDFTKRDNLLQFLYASDVPFTESAKLHYGMEREVNLALLVRFEGNKVICRIKCPINPLPIRGEFEVVSVTEIIKLLSSLGWNFKHRYTSAIFR